MGYSSTVLSGQGGGGFDMTDTSRHGVSNGGVRIAFSVRVWWLRGRVVLGLELLFVVGSGVVWGCVVVGLIQY